MAVMLRVLLDPPAKADGGQQSTQQAKGQRIPGGTKHLAVPRVMPDEGDLGKHEREERGIQELQPEEMRQHQETKCQPEATQHLQGFACEIERLSVEQALLCKEPLQLGILTTVRVGLHSGMPLRLLAAGPSP
jgi:hypothetical protein